MKKILFIIFSYLIIFTSSSYAAKPQIDENVIGDYYAGIIEDKWTVNSSKSEKINFLMKFYLSTYFSTISYDYKFKVLEKPSSNAFCIPSGHIYITETLLNSMDLDSELFFILFHEVAHQEKKHFINHLNQKLRDIDQPNIKYISLQIINKGYSYEDEIESDKFAFDLLAKINLNLGSGALFFYKDLVSNQSSNVENSSHPSTYDRLKIQLKLIEEYSHNKISISYYGEYSEIYFNDFNSSLKLSTPTIFLMSGILAKEYH